jgi:isopentenyl diphosphate isomerase/L-lactate dehydrogenase-like FMN-dependent dehydrogenase
MALPFLRAVKNGGLEMAHAHYHRVVEGLKIAMLLTGSATPIDLETTPRRLGPNLRNWIE